MKDIKNETILCRIIPLEDVYELSFRLALKISSTGFSPDLVIAVARGGFIPSRFLSDFLQIESLESIQIRHYGPGANRLKDTTIEAPFTDKISGRKVLIVDDINDTGDSLKAAVDHIQTLNPSEIKTAVLHERINSSFRTDSFSELERTNKWLIYPWAIIEDLKYFLKRLDPPAKNKAEIHERLVRELGLEIPHEQFKKALRFIELK